MLLIQKYSDFEYQLHINRYIWADMKAYIRQRMCVNLAQVREAIGEYWDELTPEKCATFIGTLREVTTSFLNSTLLIHTVLYLIS
jgi:hypothetical protein